LQIFQELNIPTKSDFLIGTINTYLSGSLTKTRLTGFSKLDFNPEMGRLFRLSFGHAMDGGSVEAD
jgi:hypothetical protein